MSNNFIDNNVIQKSNYLISCKYKGSLLENQIITLGLGRITEKDGQPYACVLVKELKEITNNYGKNIYRDAKRVTKSMVNHSIIIEDGDTADLDVEQGKILAMSFITNANYTNGKIEMWFNRVLSPVTIDLKRNFTSLEKSILMSFKKDYTFRIYELFRKEIHKMTEKKKQINVNYPLNEFKAIIGIIDLNNTEVKLAIEKGKSFDYIAEHVKVDKQFKRWQDFKVKVLDVANEEMKAISDIYFEYEPIKSGRGGKVVSIDFTIFKRETVIDISNKQRLIDELDSKYEEQCSLFEYNEKVSELIEYVGGIVSETQAYDLLQTAEYNLELIKECHDYSKTQKIINNYMSWMKSAIARGGYKETKPIVMIEGSVEQGEKVTNIMNDYNETKEDTSKAAWENVVKKKPDFKEFLAYYDIDEELLELTKTSEECIKLYVDWKLKRG